MTRLIHIFLRRFKTKFLKEFFLSLVPSLFRNERMLIYSMRLDGSAGRSKTWKASDSLNVRKGTIEDLIIVRSKMKHLPWELQCDLFDGVKDFFVWVSQSEIRHICWIYYRNDPNRFLALGSDEAEIKSVITFPPFRGKGAFPAVVEEITQYLRERGFRCLYGCVEEGNQASIRGFEKSGFSLVGQMRFRKILGKQVSPRIRTETLRDVADGSLQSEPPSLLRTAKKRSVLDFTFIGREPRLDWDRFVSGCHSGHFMQSFAWGRFKEESGWRAEYLMVTSNGLAAGAALLLSRALPVTGMRIYSLPRGPAVKKGDQSTLSPLLKRIREHVREQGGVFLRADPYIVESTDCDESFRRAGFEKIERSWSYWNSPQYVFWLNLEQGLENILREMPKKKRYEIRAAHKKGVTYVRGGYEDLGEFYALMLETAERKGIGSHNLAYYRTLYRILGESMTPQLFLGRHEGETVAAGISLAYGDKAWLLYLASSQKHFHLMPNRAIQWEMIQWAHEMGCSRYDFRGTGTEDPPNPQNPGYGVYKFKKSFGPVFTRMAGYYDAVISYPLHRVFRFGEDRLLPWFAETAVKYPYVVKRIIR